MEIGIVKQYLSFVSYLDFNLKQTLTIHLKTLTEKETQLKLLIETVKKTIQKEEGKIAMTDTEKFQGLKKTLVKENEKKYGKEICEAYGEDTVNKSNAKFMNLTEEQYRHMETLGNEIQTALETAVNAHVAPSGPDGAKIANMHKEWLSYTWPSYSAEAHRGLGQMYMEDERFQDYFDKNVKGCSKFLNESIQQHIR